MERDDRRFWLITGGIGALMGTDVVLMVAAAPGDAVKSSPKSAEAAPAPAAPFPRPGMKSSRFSLRAIFKRQDIFAKVQGDGAFTRMGEPSPGQWLWQFKEPGQILAEYAREVVNRKTSARHTFHLQPFSDLNKPQRRTLRPLRQYLSVFFQIPVTRLPFRPLKQRWFTTARQQYSADKIVLELAGQVPDNSLGVFAVLGSDLYTPRLNFVFGLALLTRRASVHSLNRYGTDPKRLLRRAMAMSTHELGHILGLRHCVFYQCVMNGANSLYEADSHPLHLCPVCLAKLQWNLGFEAPARYVALAYFFAKEGFDVEARFARDRALELSSRAPPDLPPEARQNLSP